MSFLSALKDLFRPQQIVSRAELAKFIESRSAYLVQKSMMEYCQARANMLFSTLIGEADFRTAYEYARWHAYPAGLAMVTEMAEGLLRPCANDRLVELHAALIGIAKDVYAGFPLPDGGAPDFWLRAAETLDRDLGLAGLAPPKPWREIPERYARTVFDLLPIHNRVKSHDFGMFQNNLRFHLTEIGAEFEDKADLGKLAQDLLDQAGQSGSGSPISGPAPR